MDGFSRGPAKGFPVLTAALSESAQDIRQAQTPDCELLNYKPERQIPENGAHSRPDQNVTHEMHSDNHPGNCHVRSQHQ
ncbi:MAG: hypothetical protein QOJ99_4566 [Bryobacterales bacterium]|nr:hypothetical protein [Bryobacterales bacterium]